MLVELGFISIPIASRRMVHSVDSLDCWALEAGVPITFGITPLTVERLAFAEYQPVSPLTFVAFGQSMVGTWRDRDANAMDHLGTQVGGVMNGELCGLFSG